MKIDSIEDTLYFLAGLDVAHTSTVLSEGGTTGQAGLVVSPTLNKLDATNWTDNQWFNFVCGLIKVAAGQTPPTPFPEYIEGYNFAIIPPDTVYARGTANEIVWTGVDEVILQVGTLEGSTITYKTYLINLTNLTLTFLYDGEIQAPKDYICFYGKIAYQAADDYDTYLDFDTSRIGDYYFTAHIEASIQQSSHTYSSNIVNNACAGSQATSRETLQTYTSNMGNPRYCTSLGTWIHIWNVAGANLHFVQSGRTPTPGIVDNWYYTGSLELLISLTVNGSSRNVIAVKDCGDNIILCVTDGANITGYEFTDCDFVFDLFVSANHSQSSLLGTFTGRMFNSMVDWYAKGTNEIFMSFADQNRMTFLQPQASQDIVELEYPHNCINIIGFIPPGVSYNDSGVYRQWTPNSYALVVTRSSAGDRTYRLNYDTGDLIYEHDGVITSPMSSFMWNTERNTLDAVHMSGNDYYALESTGSQTLLEAFSLTATGISYSDRQFLVSGMRSTIFKLGDKLVLANVNSSPSMISYRIDYWGRPQDSGTVSTPTVRNTVTSQSYPVNSVFVDDGYLMLLCRVYSQDYSTFDYKVYEFSIDQTRTYINGQFTGYSYNSEHLQDRLFALKRLGNVCIARITKNGTTFMLTRQQSQETVEIV